MEPLLFLKVGNTQMSSKRKYNLADSAVQQWKCFTIGPSDFTFSHLDASKRTFTHPERNESYTLYFTISHHVFTRSIKDGEDVSPNQIYPYPIDSRVFDQTRYELSHYLPHILDTLPEQFCYHGGWGRYCSCKITREDGDEVYYQVVYRVWKERGKMRFHVESAYPLDDKLKGVKRVSFWVICYNLLHNKKLPSPALN